MDGLTEETKMLYTEILDKWWVGYELTHKATTVHNNLLILNAHIKPYFSDVQVEEITPDLLQQYISDKLAAGSPLRHPAGLSPMTVRKHATLLNLSLEWATERGYVKENPMKLVILPAKTYTEVTTFSAEEVHKLIRAARPKWFGKVIEIAFRTGMRRGEIYGLKWEDLKLSDGYLMVRRSIAATKPGEFIVQSPKTQKSIRRISLDSQCIQLFKQMKGRAKSEWVIENQYGKPISPWYTTKYMRKACDTAEIPRRKFHSLRHTHATILMGANVHPKIVAERLGDTLAVTLIIYSHVLPTMQAAAVSVFDGI